MKTIMVNAMSKVNDCKSLWYNDPMWNAAINYGVKRGWLRRLSVTQVEWREELFDRLSDGRYMFKANVF